MHSEDLLRKSVADAEAKLKLEQQKLMKAEGAFGQFVSKKDDLQRQLDDSKDRDLRNSETYHHNTYDVKSYARLHHEIADTKKAMTELEVLI
jgi:hypothetical protein